MKFDIVTIFPYAFNSYLNESILKRAQKKGLIQIKTHNLRDFTKDKSRSHSDRGSSTRWSGHKKVDDKPYGGGPGMVIKIEPIIKAIGSILKISNSQFPISKKKVKIILFSPVGKQFDNKIAYQLAKNYEHLILICGHYEGIDERVKKVIRNWKRPSGELPSATVEISEFSIGPYVLTGGELAAMVLIDAVSRQIPGVLGKEESLEEKRFGVGVPVYTRPEVFIFRGKKYSAPKVLLSGNHKKIEEWRRAKQHKR